MGNGASQKAWGIPPTQGNHRTYLELPGAPFVYPAFDLTTHLLYDRHLSQLLDNS